MDFCSLPCFPLEPQWSAKHFDEIDEISTWLKPPEFDYGVESERETDKL